MCAVQIAQAVLVPLLVSKEKVGPSSLTAIKAMMVMQPPPNFTVCTPTLHSSATAPPCLVPESVLSARSAVSQPDLLCILDGS